MTTHAKLSPSSVIELCTRRIEEITAWRAAAVKSWFGANIENRHADQLALAQRLLALAQVAISVYVSPEDYELLNRPVSEES